MFNNNHHLVKIAALSSSSAFAHLKIVAQRNMLFQKLNNLNLLQICTAYFEIS